MVLVMTGTMLAQRKQPAGLLAALTCCNEGSCCSMRSRMPSVTTSMRVRLLTRVSRRTLQQQEAAMHAEQSTTC